MPIVDPEANTEVVSERRRAKNPFSEKERENEKSYPHPLLQVGDFEVATGGGISDGHRGANLIGSRPAQLSIPAFALKIPPFHSSSSMWDKGPQLCPIA